MILHRAIPSSLLPPQRRAFSLIELLASMVLMMILSFTVLTVLGAIGRSQVLEAHAALPANAWPNALLDTVRWDLINARSLQVDANSFTCAGYSSMPPGDAAAVHRPVSVRYFIKTLAGHSCLVRAETALGVRGTKADAAELACVDVAKMSVTKLDQRAGPDAASQPAANAALRVPERVSLTLWSSDPSVAPLNQILVLRD